MSADDDLIAIVGLAGRFPGAPDLRRFWSNVAGGVESVRQLGDDELLAAGESPAALRDPSYVRACPVLDDIDQFDAGFFGFAPKEAAITDPQHRLFYETAWQALEDAGHDPARFDGPVGVYATCGLNAYFMHHLVTNAELMDSVGEWLLRHTGNDMNFLATRVSYELDLKGPSLNVQTACSSSLVAVHLAAQSLLARECDMALAGGATISLPQRGYLWKEGEILSRDGHCRPFDARSSGTLFGSGAGCVVLRRLGDARKDGDTVRAVLLGSAINNDGADKVGYLAPSVEGQARAIAEALAVAGVSPDTVSYVEAHGTGTALGDPLEVAALTQAFRAQTARRGFCGLGSLKSNIGHIGEAAGVAGLIKTVLALGHRQLPPSVGYERPNPGIDFASSPFYVCDRLAEWRASGPRRAGVTALGAGGTNAHAILEEAPAVAAPVAVARPWQLVVLSARSDAACLAAATRLAAHLGDEPALDLADVAYTLQVGRRAFAHRRVAVCRDRADAVAVLGGADPKRLLAGKAREGVDVVFMFPGGGAQHAGMGAELAATEPVYRAALAECGADFAAASDRELEAPSRALPALFATEYALARLLMAWGVEPAAMIGHSMGEYVAACLAGVITVAEGMRLVATRGRLFETLPRGAMLIVPLPAAELAAIAPGFDVAAVNAPSLCVAAGPVAALAELEARLGEREVETRRVRIDVAAHSSMLEPILPEFERFCRTIPFRRPTRPYVSNLTGTWITPAEATDPRYWVQHLRGTVRFADGLATLLRQKPERALLEVGPGRTLASLALQQPARAAAAMPAMVHPKEAASGGAFLLGAVGQLWMAGVELDWAKLTPRRRRVPLPTYPFERQRHWIDRPRAVAAPVAPLTKRPDPADWFWLPSWQRAAAPVAAGAGGPARRLIFADEHGLAERLLERSPGAVVVRAGAAFAQTGARAFTLRPGERPDLERLLGELRAQGALPDEVLHLFAVGPIAEDRAQELCFTSLLHLGQALALEDQPARITVVSTGLQRIGGDGEQQPLKAMLLGPVRVIPAELPLAARSVDVVWPPAAPWQAERVVDQLLHEAAAAPDARVVAYRGPERLVQSFAPARLPPGGGGFRAGGVYLITGGLGGIGAELARHVVGQGARVVLVGRSATPAAREHVSVERADVTDLPAMRAVVARARARFGPLTGVIHAAGVLGDELIQLKTAEAAGRVLAPKVRGAWVLGELAREAQPALELFLLFSSVSSVLGPQGQVDYTAANAVLDALAADRAAREPGLSLAIGWSAWRDVGMAAVLAGHAARRSGRELSLSRDEDWRLAEHVVRGGEALLPGTALVELVAAAAPAGEGAVEVADLMLVAPFIVAGGERRVLRVVVDGAEVALESGATRHAAGHVTRVAAVAPRVELAALRARIANARPLGAGGFLPQRFMSFGPRWGNLRGLWTGADEALLELELPAAFAADLDEHPLHPALLDMATGAAQALIPGFDPERDFHVPFMYGRLRLHAPLPRRCWSHVRYLAGSSRELPGFDVTIVDDEGNACVEIAGFTMKRIADGAALAPPRAAATALREAAFREGMTPAEGLDALERILAARPGPQVVASSLDLPAWIAATEGARSAPPTAPSEAVSGAARPSVSTAFVAPRNDWEERVAGVWRSALGVGEVGVHDNFFELGGHSLLLTQLVTRVRKAAGLETPLRSLLTRLTIADMAEELARLKAEGAPVAAPIRSVSRDAYRVKRSTLEDK